LQVAVKYNIPLIIWGEGQGEYTSFDDWKEIKQIDEEHFKQQVNLGVTAEEMAGWLPQFDKRDFYAFVYPSKKELKKLDVCSIRLGNYIKWDTRTHADIIKKELGWQGQAVEGIPPEYDYEKIECKHQGVRDYIRYLRRGYGRTNHLASIDIRAGRLSRDDGLKLTEQYDGKRPASLDYLLAMWDISEDEFNAIVREHVIYPWEMGECVKGEPLYDMDKW
jgi:hypothetical protein